MFTFLNGSTNALTYVINLSIPSELPVTALRLGPKKTKNLFMFSVIVIKSRRIPTMCLALSTRGLG